MTKLNTLFLAANSKGTTQLALDQEIREITNKIRLSEGRDVLDVNSSWAVRPDDLLQLLNQHKPHIVHFSGHGSDAGEIILVDNNGNAKPVSPQALKSLFSTLKDNIQIVVLNACFSKIQGESINEVIDYVVGMNTAIGDRAAITFASSFYRALGFDRTVQEAFDQAKTALLLEGIPEENTPELLIKQGVSPHRKLSAIIANSDIDTFKTEHEFSVLPILSQAGDLNQQARDIIYTSLIDAAVEYCHLSQWQEWTYNPLEPIPRLDYDLAEDFFKFHLKVFRTDFPSTSIELERSIKTLDILLHRIAKIFQNNATTKPYNGGKFFYHGDTSIQNFDGWVTVCHQLVIDATKSANWFREVVRRDINPIFFATEGKFIVTLPWSGDCGFSHTYLPPIYTQGEKDSLPDALIENEAYRGISASEIAESLIESDFEDDF